MDNDELKQRVRELRGQGRPPKAIARALGMSPAEVGPLVRAVAEEDQGHKTERPVAGCWVSPGWSIGLSVDGHPEWPDNTEIAKDETGTASLITVIVTREHNWGKVAVCTYMVDPYCLGVKDAYGPDVADTAEVPPYVRQMYAHAPADPIQAPIELARDLVFGPVAYARSLGFEPHTDFARAAEHLGEWTGPSAITFGKNGRPFFAPGPDDNSTEILGTLKQSVGAGNFDYVEATSETSV